MGEITIKSGKDFFNSHLKKKKSFYCEEVCQI